MYREKLFYTLKTYTLHLRLPFLSTHTEALETPKQQGVAVVGVFHFFEQKEKRKKGRSASVRTKRSKAQYATMLRCDPSASPNAGTYYYLACTSPVKYVAFFISFLFCFVLLL